jgi:hypothetical protein
MSLLNTCAVDTSATKPPTKRGTRKTAANLSRKVTLGERHSGATISTLRLNAESTAAAAARRGQPSKKGQHG